MNEVLTLEVMFEQFEDGQPYAVELVELDGPLPRSRESSADERLTSPTGIRNLPLSSVGALSELLAHIAGQVGRELTKIPAEERPAEVEAEICHGMSAQTGPVWLAVKGDYTLRAKLTWK